MHSKLERYLENLNYALIHVLLINIFCIKYISLMYIYNY